MRAEGRKILDAWLSIDRRVLGIFRVLFGLVLLGDVLRRLPFLSMFYTDDGVLPSDVARNFFHDVHPLSVFLPLTTRGEAGAAFLLMGLVYVCYTLGYRTRLMQVLAVVFTSGLYIRNPFLNNGGYRMLVILSVVSLLLPIGDRYSLDALRRSMRARREQSVAELNDRVVPDTTPFRSIVVFAVLVQIAAVYFFNCVQKTDPVWRTGSAIHWILWLNTMDTSLAGWLRWHEPRWLSPLLSWGTLFFEGLAPLLVLSPFRPRLLRGLHVVGAVGMHLGIAAILRLGPFSWVMIALNSLLIPDIWLDRAGAWLGRRLHTRTVQVDLSRPGAMTRARILARLDLFERLSFVGEEAEPAKALVTRAPPPSAWARIATPLREVAGALLLLTMMAKLGHDNTWLEGRIPDALRAGPPANAFLERHGFSQTWALFSKAQIWDGTVVVDAVTASGRHLDPFTGEAPDFDAPQHGPWYQPQPLYDYFHDIRKKDHKAQRPALGDYLERWQRLEGRPEGDRVVSFEVYWVSSKAPYPGHFQVRDAHRELILSRG